jgi:hypothetical protein
MEIFYKMFSLSVPDTHIPVTNKEIHYLKRILGNKENKQYKNMILIQASVLT